MVNINAYTYTYILVIHFTGRQKLSMFTTFCISFFSYFFISTFFPQGLQMAYFKDIYLAYLICFVFNFVILKQHLFDYYLQYISTIRTEPLYTFF